MPFVNALSGVKRCFVLGRLITFTAVAAAVAGVAVANPPDGTGTRALSAGQGETRILLAQQSAASSASADITLLTKGAQAEGQLLFYLNATDNVGKRLVDKFGSKYGIKAAFLRLPANMLAQRYAAEAEAGTIASDVVLYFGNDAVAYAESAIRKGWMEPISAAGLPVIRSGEYPAKFNRDVTALVQISPWQITFNTEKLRQADYPRDWPDLLNPKYKGQVVIATPVGSRALTEFWKVMLDKYGESFLAQLSSQIGRQYASGVPAMQALAAGEGAILVPTVVAQALASKDKGAPVDSVMPSFTTGLELYVMLTDRKRAKHPNAARLFANYVMSQEGNKVLNDDPGGFSVYESARLPSQYVNTDPDAQKSAERIAKLLGSK